MRRLIFWSVIGIAAALGLWCHPGAALAQGQGIYNDRCAVCHGQDGKGNGPAAVALSPNPPDFTSPAFWQGTTKAKIVDTIENGHGPMPAFNLSSSQIQAVIDYMTQTFKPGG